MTPEAADRVTRLVRVLDAEEGFYRELRSLLQRERVCLVELDASSLEEIVAAKEALAEEGRLLEESRLQIVDELAPELGLAARPTLSQVCDQLDGPADELRSAHARLVALVGAVRELVELNAVFAGNSLGRVDATLELLGRLRFERPVYSSDPAAVPERVGRLIRSSA